MKKKLICYAVYLSVAIGIFGCGKKENTGVQAEYEPQLYSVNVAEKEETIDWTASHLSLDEPYQDGLFQDNKFYGIRNNDNQYVLDVRNLENGELISSVSINELEEINGISVSSNGLVYSSGRIDDRLYLCEIDVTANTCRQIAFEVEDIDENVIDYTEFREIYFDETGTCYIWLHVWVRAILYDETADPVSYFMADRIYVKDSGFQTLYYEQVIDRLPGSRLLSVIQEKDGSPVLIASDIEENIYLEKLHPECLEECIRTELNKEMVQVADKIYAVTEEGFLFADGNVVKEYSVKDNSVHVLFNLTTYGLVYSDVISMKKDTDSIHILNNYGDEYYTEYTKIYQDTIDKVVVFLGYIGEAGRLEKSVSKFNHFNNDIQVILKHYGNENEDYDSDLQSFKLDILRGECPDLVLVDGMGISEFVNKGLFIDLYEFLEKDTELMSTDINQQILYTYEIDGKLYSLAPEFSIHTLAGKKSIWKDSYGLSVEEMQQTLGQYGKDINAISGFSEDEPVLTDLCTTLLDELIDWKTGECYFDSDAFRDILLFTKAYEGNCFGLGEGIRDNEILLHEVELYRVADYQLLKEIYQDEISFVGFPTQKTSGTAISYLGGEIAISQLSQEKEACWEFVKFYVTNGCDGSGFPCDNRLFDEMMTEAQTDAIEYDEAGNEYVISKGYYYEMGCEIEVYAAASDDIRIIRELIQRADIKREYHSDIVDIITEETQPYFQNQKDADEVAKVLQSRILLYLQEQND